MQNEAAQLAHLGAVRLQETGAPIQQCDRVRHRRVTHGHRSVNDQAHTGCTCEAAGCQQGQTCKQVQGAGLIHNHHCSCIVEITTVVAAALETHTHLLLPVHIGLVCSMNVCKLGSMRTNADKCANVLSKLGSVSNHLPILQR